MSNQDIIDNILVYIFALAFPAFTYISIVWVLVFANAITTTSIILNPLYAPLQYDSPIVTRPNCYRLGDVTSGVATTEYTLSSP